MSVTAMATDIQPKSIFTSMRRFSRQNARQSDRMAAEGYQAYLRDLDEAGYEIDAETGKPRKKATPKQAPALAANE